jgi:putative PIN family toxin of toxin-antitoxin system
MRLVLDTNVVMELLHWYDPRSVTLSAALQSGELCCFTDTDCLEELRRVLAYPKFALDEGAQASLFAHYAALAAAVPPGVTTAVLPRCRDADDQKFLEVAARSGADLLVTRDRELLRLARSRRHPAPFAIVTPEQAIEKLFSTRKDAA